jgi:hypothetical protein
MKPTPKAILLLLQSNFRWYASIYSLVLLPIDNRYSTPTQKNLFPSSALDE